MLLELPVKYCLVRAGFSKSSAFLEDPTWVRQHFGDSTQYSS